MIAIDNLNRDIASLNDRNIASENQHSAMIGSMQITITDSQRAIKNLLASKFTDLSQLSQTYFQHYGQKNAQVKVYEQVKKLIERINSDKHFNNDLEETINKSLNNLMSNFRKDFPNLNMWEYSLFMYNICGVEPKSVALFLQEKTELIYKRKANLKKKISSSNSPLRDDYLSYL